MFAIFSMAGAAPLALHVTGNTIYNSNNTPVVLRGMDVPSLEWGNTGEGPGGSIVASITNVINTWHGNLIRLPLCQDRWYGYAPGQTDGGTAYRALVAQCVSTASNAGVYILLDMHWSDEGVWGSNLGQHQMPDGNTATAWTAIAGTFANNPAVLFDAYNEPAPSGTGAALWNLWRNGGTVSEGSGYTSPGMQGLVNAIRGTGANNLIAVGGIAYASDETGEVNGYQITGSNIIYSAHIYPSDSNNWDAYVTVAAKQAPILIGEFGVNPNNTYYSWLPAMLKWITLHNYSATAWCLHPAASPNLILDWNTTNNIPDLTFWYGTYVYSWLLGGPSNPTNLQATGSSGQVSLTWTAVSGATSYDIYRSSTPVVPSNIPTPIATGVTGASYNDTNVTNGSTYYYWVTAVNSTASSGPSNCMGATAGAAGDWLEIYDNQLESGFTSSSWASVNFSNTSPTYGGSPDSVSVTAAQYQAMAINTYWLNTSPYSTLSFWINPGSNSGETVNVNSDIDATYATPVIIGPLAANTWTHESIPLSAFGVANVIQCDGYTWGNPNSATETFYLADIQMLGPGVGSAPAQPTGLTATSSSQQVALTWNASSGATSYTVYRGTTVGGENPVPIATGITSASYTDTGLANNTAYYYEVAALNGNGTSGFSNEATATTPSPNVHSGLYSVKVVMTSTVTWSNLSQVMSCPANTNCVASVWIKGSGDMALIVGNGNYGAVITYTECAATGTWQQVSIPFNTGSNSQITFALQDQYGVAGTAYVDDCFVGVSGGANLLTNPGFELGGTPWSISNTNVWSIGEW